MDRNDEKFMRQALDLARTALQNGYIPVGAVFVLDGHVIANGMKNGMSHAHFDHAEHNGCYQALWSRIGPRNLEGVTVYSTLEPCIMCLGMLMTTRVSRIVYACEDPYGGGEWILKDPERLPARFRHERPTIEGGVLREDSARLLREFFQGRKDGVWSDPENPLVKAVVRETA